MAGIFARSKRRSASPEVRALDAAGGALPDESTVTSILAVEAAVADAAASTDAVALADAAALTDGGADVVSPSAPYGARTDDTVELSVVRSTVDAVPAVTHAPPAGRPNRALRTWGLGRELLRVLATAYLSAYASLMVWSMVPMVAGWTPAVVISGSMQPSIHIGDVVFYAHEDPATIKPGRVVLVDDPNRPGRLLSHRLHQRKDDGTIVTKGDANAAPDSTPVKPEHVHGAARLIIPYVGKVTLWQVENRSQAILWSMITGVALIFARTPNPPRGRHAANGRPASSA